VWLVDYVDRKGKRHQEVVRDALGNSTREMAEKRLEEIVHEKRENIVTARERRDFKKLREQYAKDVASAVSKHTLKEYQHIIDTRLAPTLDDLRVDDIGVATVRALKADLTAKGMAPRTVNKTLTLLSMVLDVAVQDREVAFNPCDHVRKVPVRKTSVDADSGEVEERRALTREEVAALLDAAQAIAEEASAYAAKLKVEAARVRYRHSHWCYHALLVTAARTGLRASELYGLRWEDVDLTSASIRVRRRYRNGDFDVPKSDTSTRSVPLTADAVATLRGWRMRSPFKASGALVFCTVKGKPLGNSNVARRAVAPAAKRAKIVGAGMHALRHTFGSQLLAAGEDLATVSKLMGHASVAITASVYTHAVAKPGAETTSKLEAYLAAK
jgi:integrase